MRLLSMNVAKRFGLTLLFLLVGTTLWRNDLIGAPFPDTKIPTNDK